MQENNLQRKSLAIGNEYRFHGYRKNGFRIVAMSLPETSSDDGGCPGVAIQRIGTSARFRKNKRAWYIFNSEAEFWKSFLFNNACDSECA